MTFDNDNIQRPIMTCGHAANGICHRLNNVDFPAPVHACVICDCVDINATAPNLTGRLAKCAYYMKETRKCECNACDKNGSRFCKCMRPSDAERLAFFEHRPMAEFDKFYCGCHGWD